MWYNEGRKEGDNMLEQNVFPKRLEQAMFESNTNQVELAQKTGLTHASISRYLAGKIEPRQDKIHAMAKALGVDPVWLCGFDVAMHKNDKREEWIDYIVSLPDDKLEFIVETARRLR